MHPKNYEATLMNRISLKNQIHYLSYLLFILTFLSMSIEIALKSRPISSFVGLFTPVIDSFYWPRFVIFLLPSLLLIILSGINKKHYESILKVFFMLAAPIVVQQSTNLYFSYKIVSFFNQPEQFMQFYYVLLFSKTIVLLGTIILGTVWTFRKEQKTATGTLPQIST